MRSDSRFDLVFRSDRFNLSRRRDYFINDCCFGDDAAAWLTTKLRERGLSPSSPGQEDWGWYFDVAFGGERYFVGVGGTPDEPGESETPAAADRGEWRLMIEKRRTLWEKLRRRNLLAEDDPFLKLLRDILVDADGIEFAGME